MNIMINWTAISAIEEQLDDLNTMFDDLSDKISDKQTSLIQTKELRENLDKQVIFLSF